MKHQNNDLLNQNINLRLTSYDFNLIAAEAEERGMGKADVLRAAWREHLNQREISSLLAGLEQRLTKKIFEILTAVAGLDDGERLLAIKKYKTRMNEGSTDESTT
ncbi:hypothetical protein GCM10011613_01170 [Cellvibrio zantedeschiae]|uniref:Ribbon-helix-helix protein CopG domain-containing protein n=1 Tax=Cellvibrio zantedeschiae TaxID=1237077 RepID=A0ABQ3APB7_9GAMM|nr:hypothetical protein [Cellvibrio zantedeschiae]GGY61536.1 hypothetical protein GCM10011613_01170 [Cellvibrio zantedeschiae]